MKNEIIVHPGYSKTATTWLQDEIFAKLGPEIYLGKHTGHFPRWIIEINYLDDAAYDRRLDKLRENVRKHTKGKPISILSSEAFTNLGVVHSQAKRIREVFGQVKVILILRNPISWIVSNYKYCVQYENFYKRLEDYLDFGEKRTPFSIEKRPPFYLPDYFYNETVETYYKLFGKERVLLHRYEDFRYNPREFGRKLEEFIGLSLPDFVEASSKKILVSPDDSEIERMRVDNLYSIIKNNIDGDFQLDISSLKKLSSSTRPILDSETENKLKELFKVHCSEYYPELAE